MTQITEKYSSQYFPEESIKAQLYSRFATISTIESYLLANSEDSSENSEEMITSLAQNTLAYSQLSGEQKVVLVQVFSLILTKLLTLEASPTSLHE